MPTIPAGGLSIFINIAILLLGSLSKFLRKAGLYLPGSILVYNFFIEKKFDSIYRRLLGYSIVTTLFILMFSVTSISLFQRFTHESNLDYIKTGVEKVILIYKNNIPDSIEKEIKSEIKIDLNNLAINN